MREDRRLSRSFKASEFWCPCGSCDGGDMDFSFVLKLQELRDAMGEAVVISSGFRCKARNEAVKGSPHSMHLYGLGVDIPTKARDANYVYRLVYHMMRIGFKGIGVYKHHVHCDARLGKACAWWGK